jgi:MFS family permease
MCIFSFVLNRFGRRPIMSVSFVLMSISGFLCAFGPQERSGVWSSYIIFTIARFLLACSTRGISVSGFVLGSEIGKIYIIFVKSSRALKKAVSAIPVGLKM